MSYAAVSNLPYRCRRLPVRARYALLAMIHHIQYWLINDGIWIEHEEKIIVKYRSLRNIFNLNRIFALHLVRLRQCK